MPKKSQREGCHHCRAFSPHKFTQKGWQYSDKTGKWLLFLPFLPLQELFLQTQHFLLPALQENFWQAPLEAAKAQPMSVGKVQTKCFKCLLDWHGYPNKGSCWSCLQPSQLKQLSTHTSTAAVELPGSSRRKILHWTTSPLLKSPTSNKWENI